MGEPAGDRKDEIRLVLSKSQLKGLLCLSLMAGGAYALMSESFTLSTYYPAPSGVYNKLVTTGDTFLARDPGGNVGVGTTSPGAKLEVNGNVIAADPTASNHLATKAYVDANSGSGGKTWFRTSGTARGTADALALCTAAGAYHMCYPGEWIGWTWDTSKGDTSSAWNTPAWVNAHTNSVSDNGADCGNWNPSQAPYWTWCNPQYIPQYCAWYGCGTSVVLSRQLSNDITQFAVAAYTDCTDNNGHYTNSCWPIISNPYSQGNSSTTPYPLQCCSQALPAMCCHN